VERSATTLIELPRRHRARLSGGFFLGPLSGLRPMTPLFFLPGAGASPLFWRPLGDRLPTDRPKVYFGWPGLGDQPADPSINSLDDLVALVENRVGPDPVDLLAQSMGGIVAVKLALKRPGSVRRIVLLVTSGGVDAAVRAHAAHDWRGPYRAEYPKAASWITEDREDLTHEIPRIACPVLLLFGDADPIAPPYVGERLAELLPNARLQVIRGGDHSLVANRVDEVLPQVGEFLARP
jgi:pimeloyl-ACP methyl ester carboxylesterase